MWANRSPPYGLVGRDWKTVGEPRNVEGNGGGAEEADVDSQGFWERDLGFYWIIALDVWGNGLFNRVILQCAFVFDVNSKSEMKLMTEVKWLEHAWTKFAIWLRPVEKFCPVRRLVRWKRMGRRWKLVMIVFLMSQRCFIGSWWRHRMSWKNTSKQDLNANRNAIVHCFNACFEQIQYSAISL